MKVCVCVRAVFSSKQARRWVWCGVGGESAETIVIPRGIQNIRLLRVLRPRKQVRELPCVLRAAVLACCDRYP